MLLSLCNCMLNWLSSHLIPDAGPCLLQSVPTKNTLRGMFICCAGPVPSTRPQHWHTNLIKGSRHKCSVLQTVVIMDSPLRDTAIQYGHNSSALHRESTGHFIILMYIRRGSNWSQPANTIIFFYVYVRHSFSFLFYTIDWLFVESRKGTMQMQSLCSWHRFLVEC